MLLYLVCLGFRLSPTLTPDEIQALTVDERTQRILEMVSTKHDRSDWLLPITLVVMAPVMAVIGLRPFSRILQQSSRSVFYWGDTVPIHDAFERRITRVEWGVGVAFVVSLLASMVGGIMLK